MTVTLQTEIHDVPSVVATTTTEQPTSLQTAAPKGTKRQRVDERPEPTNGASHSIYESLTPRATSRCPAPNGFLEFYNDDCHEEYEWIRLPKKRDYDLFKAPRLRPEDRNNAQVPLTAIRYDDGAKVTMWAKMDTGAGASTINRSTLEALLGSAAHTRQRPMTTKEIHMLGEQHINVTHSVHLDFEAGISKRKFEKVNFLVIPDKVEESSIDGVNNVILSYDFLRENSMLMIDLEYCDDADESLPVIADRAENEDKDALSILPSHASQVRGLSQQPGAIRVRR